MNHFSACVGMILGAGLLAGSDTAIAEVSGVNIGSRRELFVDRHLIDKLDGASLQLHHPRPADIALRFDRPYEGVFAGYTTVIKDGDTYRMYYRGLAAAADGEANHSVGKEVTCYAESRDGIRWDKPNLGLFEINGNRDNNIVLAMTPACHNFCPFLDTRPGVEPAQRFKAVGGHGKAALLALVSADGLHWKKLQDKPIFTKGAFDSQNLAFWSESENCYVCYFRAGKKIGNKAYRWISRTTSKDFLNWSEPVEMDFGDVPPEHFYTNQTGPYYRAPHLYVAVFARFNPGRQLIASADQAQRLGIVGDYFSDTSDACFMTTRGGSHFDRTFMESFVRPGMGAANWVSRTNYPALGIVPTGENEMSLYVQRHYAQPSHCLQRLTLRPDGFVSVHAPYSGAEMITKPLVFSGKELTINFATSAAGALQVEIQDAAGRAIPGFALTDSTESFGDELERVVTWKSGADASKLAGQPVRLRFVMKDADLYAIRFR
ncbi:MAG TPA: hypothetical protein VLM89_05395 [Phycisphaerae bacterium]|nr:hypothetical protein [Phycisphaerae bacterium]